MKSWLDYFIELSYDEEHWKKSATSETDRYVGPPNKSRNIRWFHWILRVRTKEDN